MLLVVGGGSKVVDRVGVENQDIGDKLFGVALRDGEGVDLEVGDLSGCNRKFELPVEFGDVVNLYGIECVSEEDLH